MKSLPTKSLALAVVVGSLCFTQVASAAPVVSIYGQQLNTPEWRSTNVTKTIALEGGGSVIDSDGYYGTDGWLLPNIVDIPWLPSYLQVAGVTAPGTSTFTSASYAQDVDNPTETPGSNVANLPEAYWSIAFQAPGASTEVNLYNFAFSGTVPNSFLLGIAYGNLETTGEDYFGTASFRASINGVGSTAQVTAEPNNKQIDWIFFRVDGATAGDTFNLYGTSGPVANGGVNIAAVSFDTIPEPSTFVLLGLGLGFALLCRRRRRNI